MKRGCTQCGECLNVCPVFREFSREEYSPKAKRLLMEPHDKEFAIDKVIPWAQVKRLARLCAGCGRCKQACARKLSTADLLADVRANHPEWRQYLWEIWMNYMGPLWPTMGFAASLMPEALTPEALKSSIAPAKALVNKKNIQPWARIDPAPGAKVDTSSPLVVFGGCTATRVRKQWLQKTDELLRRWGYTMLDPTGFTCCGGTMHHAGQYRAMNSMRDRNVEYWKSIGRPRIVAFCASCYHSLEEYAEAYLEGEEAKTWKKSLTPLSALLVEPVARATSQAPASYGYHQPCHWNTGDKDMPFLKSIQPGLEKGKGLCCGMGGILKMSNPDLSMNMAYSCLGGFTPEITNIVTGCSGCSMQLQAAAPEGVSIYHWLDIVA